MGQLRFLLAVAVIAFHSGLHVPGPLAVYSFFIMSGYAIFAGLHESKEKSLGVIKFFRRRLKKLLPHYLFACVAVTLILVLAEKWRPHSTKTLIASSHYYESTNSWGILKNFLPTLTFSPWPIRLNPNVALVPPWWSVVLELGFYAICAVVVYSYRGKREVLYAYFAVTLLLHIYLLVVTGQNLSSLNMYVYFSFFGTLVFFALGNLCRYFSKSIKVNSTVGKAAFYSLVLFIFLFTYAFGDPTQLIPGRPVWGYLFAVYFVTVATALFLLNLPQGRITNKRENFFANHSYGIYVWQSAAFLLIDLLEKEHKIPATVGFPRFIPVLALTILFSLASSKSIGYLTLMFRNAIKAKQ